MATDAKLQTVSLGATPEDLAMLETLRKWKGLNTSSLIRMLIREKMDEYNRAHTAAPVAN